MALLGGLSLLASVGDEEGGEADSLGEQHRGDIRLALQQADLLSSRPHPQDLSGSLQIPADHAGEGHPLRAAPLQPHLHVLRR